ncbi:MAG: hypothetical protein ACYS76_02005 [Planctomycetota bacterium]|jgi:hypothetical protein
MKTDNYIRTVIVGLALVCISAFCVRADRLALQEKLSKEVEIQLRDVTIAEALEEIGRKAGVKFVLSDEATWRLPHGEVTRLSLMMQGPLAESMTEMLNAFFMRYAVGDEEITIYPRPELDHIMGRPTTKQLGLLRAIYTNAIAEYTDGPQNTVNVALGEEVAVVPYTVHDTIDSIFHQMAGKQRQSPRPEDVRFKLSAPMTVAQLLDQIDVYGYDFRRKVRTHQDGRWCISRIDFPEQIPEIRIVSEKDFREAKVDQLVDISFKDEKAEVILQRLGRWTGMHFIVDTTDPSWLRETISVDMQNITLRQAIRNIAAIVDGHVGINTEENEIVIEGPVHEKKKAAPETAERKGADYVGKISIPMDGGRYYIEFMLRESDLTDELKKLRQEKIKKVLGESPKLK